MPFVKLSIFERFCLPARRTVTALICGGILVSQSSCAPVGPDYRPPVSDLPGGWPALAGATGQPLAVAELQQWWQQFHDPLLDELVSRATEANPDLQIASARLVQARARAKMAGAAVYPELAGFADYRHSGKSENVKGSSSTSQGLYQAGFDAGWELDLFGGLRRSGEAAAARVDVARENSRDVLISLQADVARYYFELRGYQQRLTAAESSLAALRQSFDLTQERQSGGFATALDVAQAETALATYQARLPELAQGAAASVQQLELLLGLTPGRLTAELDARQALPQPSSALPQLLPSELLRRRPDIRRAERELAAATADIGVAIAELFPKFSLTALIGLQSTRLGDLLHSGSRYWTVGPALDWALFDGGRLQAGVELNRALATEAQLTYEKTVLEALAEVNGLLNDLRYEREIQQALVVAVTAAEHSLALADGRYRVGVATYLDVLAGERTLSQSRDQLILSTQRVNLKLIALFKALGGGWSVTADSALPSESGA